MNSISNTVLYHDFLYGLNNYSGSDTIGNIKEYVCGERMMQSTEVDCFETSVSSLKKHLAEADVDAKIETYIGEQGNICFFSKLLVEGVNYLAIPLTLAEDVNMFLCLDRLDMGIDSKPVIVEACNMGAHLSKLVEECEDVDSLRMIQDILCKIPEDTLCKMVDPKTYADKLKDTFGTEFEGLPEESLKSGIGVYLSGKGDNDVTGLFYDQLTPNIEGKNVLDDANGMQLVCCRTESYREFVIFEEKEMNTTDLIEGYFLVDTASNLRQISVLLAESNVAREIRKQTTDKANPDKVARDVGKAIDTDVGVRQAAAVPQTFSKKVMEINRKLRGFIANWRRAHDDSLREKLYNDEYIPLIDDIFEILISGAVGYGTVAIGLVNPLVGVALGIVTFIFANWRQRAHRKRIIELLDDKIKLLGEEIDDARLDSDLVTKRQLIQIKTQLERKRAKIQVGNSLGSR